MELIKSEKPYTVKTLSIKPPIFGKYVCQCLLTVVFTLVKLWTPSTVHVALWEGQLTILEWNSRCHCPDHY